MFVNCQVLSFFFFQIFPESMPTFVDFSPFFINLTLMLKRNLILRNSNFEFWVIDHLDPLTFRWPCWVIYPSKLCNIYFSKLHPMVITVLKSAFCLSRDRINHLNFWTYLAKLGFVRPKMTQIIRHRSGQSS